MDEPQGLTRQPPADEWLRWFWLWDIYFAVGYVGISALLLLSDAHPVSRFGSVGVLTVMVVWYVIYGRPFIVETVPSTPRRGRLFAGGVVLLMVLAVVFAGEASFALFAACPLIFMSLPLREAVPVVVVIALLPGLGVLIREGSATALSMLGPSTFFTIVLSLALGIWITRIVNQSEERGALIRELEASREEITRLSREAGVTAERSRLATEIHDTLAQGFTSLVTLVQAAESELDRDTGRARKHLALAERTARENLGEARALVAGLMPSALGTGSLDEAIRRQLERLTEETSIRVIYRVEGETGTLPTVVEVVLLRAVQESLTNVRKHSGASEVTICLRATGSTVSLRVADNGAGFDTTRMIDLGYGLRGMRSRATQIGGTLNVDGVDGTTVELEVPL